MSYNETKETVCMIDLKKGQKFIICKIVFKVLESPIWNGRDRCVEVKTDKGIVRNSGFYSTVIKGG